MDIRFLINLSYIRATYLNLWSLNWDAFAKFSQSVRANFEPDHLKMSDASQETDFTLDLCDNILQQCASMPSPRRLHRQSTENDDSDNFLLQVKTFESNYGQCDVKENVSLNLRRPAARATRIFWILGTASSARTCRPMVTSTGARRRIAEIVSRPGRFWTWTDIERRGMKGQKRVVPTFVDAWRGGRWQRWVNFATNWEKVRIDIFFIIFRLREIVPRLWCTDRYQHCSLANFARGSFKWRRMEIMMLDICQETRNWFARNDRI